MHLADDRRDVVLAMRFETDVLQRDDLVVAIGFLEGALEQCYRIHVVAAEELFVGAHDAVGSAKQPFAVGIVAGPAEQSADRFHRFLAGRRRRAEGLCGTSFGYRYRGGESS